MHPPPILGCIRRYLERWSRDNVDAQTNGSVSSLAAFTTAQAQVFEKVTIRPARSLDPSSRRDQVLPNGDLKGNAVNVISLLTYAYGVPANPSSRLSALPDWVYS